MRCVEVRLPDGREIVILDWPGTVEQACEMVERHYPDAVSAVIREGGVDVAVHD